MKKKLLTVVLVCIIALVGSQAFAAASEITPYFNVVSRVNTSISGGTNCIYSDIFVYAPQSTSLDKVYADVKLKRTSGTVVKSYGQYMDKSIATFKFNESTPIYTKGTFFFEYTVTCYKNDKVVDTISGTSRTYTYEP